MNEPKPESKTLYTEQVQVKITYQQLAGLQRQRFATKVPMAELIRQAIDAYLAKAQS